LEGGWQRAEHTAHDMIADLNSWSSGWIDWNLMLSYDGGPNHAGNLCDSPIIANEVPWWIMTNPSSIPLGLECVHVHYSRHGVYPRLFTSEA
ncbi:unnamed protein product, partial [Sphacelaria rigidula]